ncbi:MAG: hypothetical protein ACOC20_01050 [Oceanicaulis sp.]
MSHVRTAIRDLIHTRLDGETSAGASVFKNRVKPVAKSDLPAISITSGDERVERIAQGKPARLGRIMQVHCDLIADADADGAADDLDALAAEIETLLAPGSWATNIFDITPVAITEIYDGNGDRVVGQSRLTFEVEYHTGEGAPGTAL